MLRPSIKMCFLWVASWHVADTRWSEDTSCLIKEAGHCVSTAPGTQAPVSRGRYL
jgi:hypothetical protein